MAIKTVLTCDYCEENGKSPSTTLELSGPYMYAKKEMKEKGWVNRRDKGEYRIKCPECQEVKR